MMREEIANKEIMDMVVDAVMEKLGREYGVSAGKTRKNNGLMLSSVTIRKNGEAVAPNIYVDNMLGEIVRGNTSVSDAAVEIINIYNESVGGCGYEETLRKLGRNSILKLVRYKLVNAEKNAENLRSIPHSRILDLAVTYNVVLSCDEYGSASFEVSNKVCEAFGISMEDLDSAARVNTEANGFRVMTMSEVIAEIAKENGCKAPVIDGTDPVIVLSSTDRVNGASVMLYSGYFDAIANSAEDDLYVLPSSIHEVIAIPADGLEPDGLRSMVSEINSKEVRADEVLSGNIYRYVRERKEFSIA